MGRVATHWKLKDKERELSLLRSRIISFHTTMDMNLKMIHMCLFLGAQEGNVKKQDSVLSELNQLRREIEQLTIMSDNRGVHDAKSVPATDNRGPSNTNNPKVVLGRGIPHGANSIKVQQPQSALGGNPLATKPAEPMFSTVETQHMQDIQLARSLLEGDHTERAKSLCRKVIHATDSNVGNMHRSHKNALQTLAHIYERTGDHEDAAQIRLLLDIQGHNTIRQEFKAMVQKQEFQKGIDYAYRWAILLQDNAALHAYSPYLEGLRMDRKYSSSVLFTAVCIMGNTLLAQTLLSQGASIHGQIYATLYGKRSALSPFGCAIHFGHCHLVRDLLEAASESLDSFIISNHFDLAINVWNPEICRVLLNHMLSLHKSNMMRQFDLRETSSSIDSEKLQVGALLEGKSAGSNGSGGSWNALLSALNKAISQKDQAMTKLLLSYGIRSPDTIQLITRMNWLEGVQVAATQASHVSEEDITYAFQSRNLDICNYLLSLNPKCATSVTNDAMEGAGIEGLQMVIKFGANVNHPVYWSSAKRMGPLYPLHFAVHIGSSEMVKALLAAGADVRNQDEVGQTALQFAIKKGQRKDLPEKGISATMGIVALLKGVEPRKTNSGATTSSYSKGSSLRSWWSSSKRHQAAATVGN